MNANVDPKKFIGTLAFALRHDPEQFGIELDAEGWASLENLIDAIRFLRYDLADLNEEWARSVILTVDRFELRGDRIRAYYGHSVALYKLPDTGTPPGVLFHGTATCNVASIVQYGLMRMQRQFVHLSSDFDWVVQFLSNKPQWTIFAVDARHAFETGIVFRQANRHVWLADRIEPQFLDVATANDTSVLAS